MKPLIAILPALLLVAACSGQEKTQSEFRHWTTAEGRKSSVRLKVVEQTDASVKLQREDNDKIITFQKDQLSDDDQTYLASLNNPTTPSTKSGTDSDSNSTDNWPQFRGVGGAGISDAKGVPLTWSDTENIAWKKDLPGPGASSPITWGNRIYLTCYTGYGLTKEAPGDMANLKRHLICLDRDNGEIIWTADEPGGDKRLDPYTDFNTLHGYATSTPAVDADGIYVSLATSGLACYSHDGERKWKSDIGNETHGWGSSASVVLYKNLVIIHAEIESGCVIAFDKENGDEVWRVKTRGRDSWSTPLLSTTGDRDELIFHFNQGEPAKLSSVNPLTGESYWDANVLKDYLCPSPIEHDGVIYAIAYQRSAAIRTGGQGDVTDSQVKWTGTHGSEICTPVYHDGHIYFSHQESGIVYCLNAETGEEVYKHRLEPHSKNIYASAVLVDGRIYYVSKTNGTYVVAASPEFEQLAHNKIESDDSVFNATPAVSRNQLLIRSDKALYCLGE